MSRKTLVLAVFALALSAPAGWAAKGDEGKTNAGPRPMIEIPRMKQDLGNVFERDKYEYTFVVRNRGTADLVIEDVKPG